MTTTYIVRFDTVDSRTYYTVVDDATGGEVAHFTTLLEAARLASTLNDERVAA